MKTLANIFITGWILAMPAQAALAAPPPDVADLVGARGSSGETQMQARGYSFVRASRVRDESWTFWWSDVQKACVAVSTVDGRYASLERVPETNCKAQSQSQTDDRLSLVCFGEGEHTTYESHSGLEYNNDKKKYETAERLESEKKKFQTAVSLEIDGGNGRIHLEKVMIPPLNSGGSEGWWPLRDLRVEPDAISGHFKLNALNSPTIRIDRRTGLITVKGIETFTGKCDKTESGARRF
ncbi:hypothetical protein SAMN05216359_10538 [Roseateles sp. YR242]|uniref:hypothetical protein n=1 Tax=Roseateles sp. YR242 TaxID=1855305 RepID=UPI0008B5D236|nr:hypothetical protein [Roseateles sp. YR242]SEL06979.1 hypothetical protein SAMN05216359_10538 [Roseateles sp. YR242]